MEQYYTPQGSQVSVIPDDEERREIRKRYSRIALVLLINIVLFNLLGIGGSFLIQEVAGSSVFDNEIFSTLFSCGIPIISETTALIVGIKLFGEDMKLKPMLSNRDGYGEGTVAKLMVLCLGLQTAASLIASLVAEILKLFGLEGRTAELDATSSLPANLILYFYACLLGPILEELLYRGFLLQSLRKYNERFAIFLSAAIFGLMHQNYQQFILGFIVGIPLAIITIKYGTLIPAILTHIVMNTSAMVFSCWIQYTSPDFYRAALNGSTDALNMSSITPAGMAAMLCSGGFRIITAVAALVIGIISLVKGGNMRRPTAAGKARTWSVFAASAPWWIIFVLYAFLNFVYPFIV